MKKYMNPFEGLKKRIEEEYADLKDYLRILYKGELKLEPYSPEMSGPMISFPVLPGYIERERYWVDQSYAFVSHATAIQGLFSAIIVGQMTGESAYDDVR